jgi:transposase
MMSFRVHDEIDPRRGVSHGEQTATGRAVERDRGVFPTYEPSPEGGRRPKEARAVLTAIVFVLKTGIGWKDLPTEAFGVSYKTCTRRIADWTAIGLWQRMHELFLAKLRGADQLDWSRVLVDCSLVKAPLGGLKQDPIPRIAGARAASIAC